jgi:acylphosphatase
LIARRCVVAGRVQGVFYRASARARATTLGVTGLARNLPDGRVEVLACGDAAAVDALCRWLWQGSPASAVTAVEIEELEPATIRPWPAVFTTA